MLTIKKLNMASPTQLSYLYTSPAKPFNYTTLPRVVEASADSHPDQEIFIHRRPDGSRSSITNKELYERGNHLARYLVSKGIQKGDRIALIGPNTLEMVIGHVGILSAGAVILNVNIEMSNAADARQTLETAGAKFVIVDPGEQYELLQPTKAMLKHCGSNDTVEGNTRVLFLREMDLKEFDKPVTLTDIIGMDLHAVEMPSTFPEDTAVIFCTSGSTGKSKMVVHTHFNIACYPFSWYPDLEYESVDFNDRPFSWIGGSPVFHLFMRRSRVFIDASLTVTANNAEFLWAVMKEEKCTDVLLFPYVISDLLALPDSTCEDGFRLRHVSTGGQIIDNHCTKIMERFCLHMVIVYGCTEVFGLNMYGPLAAGQSLRPGEVGKPYPGVEVRVVDEEDHPVPLETVGMVQVRGPCTMKGYFGNQELTANAFAQGSWFRTGDIGKVSSNMSLAILGREKDVISRGGRKIYPGLLEDLIKQMSSIKYVCTVSVPDKRLMEEVCICFVSSEMSELMENDVKKFCEENLFADCTLDGLGVLPAYYVKFEEFASLPNGKLNRKAIQNEAVRRLHLSKD
ncbi:putative acyl--CoA ligase YdaB [Argopecten irradians]|uniref:putative acyl--CoA ligase YdaB n=1 Tax=Argopecten irradians TaxID=31199 RepID=UPI00371C6323